MRDFLRGIVDFWLIAVFRQELKLHYFDFKPYCLGFLVGCGTMFAAAGSLAIGIGLAFLHWRA